MPWWSGDLWSLSLLLGQSGTQHAPLLASVTSVICRITQWSGSAHPSLITNTQLWNTQGDLKVRMLTEVILCAHDNVIEDEGLYSFNSSKILVLGWCNRDECRVCHASEEEEMHNTEFSGKVWLKWPTWTPRIILENTTSREIHTYVDLRCAYRATSLVP